jgi:hypothetical protein
MVSSFKFSLKFGVAGWVNSEFGKEFVEFGIRNSEKGRSLEFGVWGSRFGV